MDAASPTDATAALDVATAQDADLASDAATEPDARSSEADAGLLDAETRADGGVGTGPLEPAGCGCTAAPVDGTWTLLGLLGLVAIAARRRGFTRPRTSLPVPPRRD